MPVIHVVIVKFARQLTIEEATVLISAANEMIRNIAVIKKLSCGCDMGIGGDPRMSFSLTAQFESKEAYQEYALDPVHKAFIAAHLKPVMAENGRAAIQYVI